MSARGVNMLDNVVRLDTKPKVSILPVLTKDFDDYISEGMELLAPAILRQSHNVTMQDVEDDIREGGSVMWLIHLEDKLVAAITTVVVKHPQRRNLKIEFIGGKRMRQWMSEAITFFKNLAIDAQLDALEADGRKGFEKYVDASPFRSVYTHYEMEIR
tara:strand:+ start:2019 stop:2492 length:474 start_codon:yes stop_codon:yes gene_type:complete